MKKMWKIWKKRELNSEKIWKIWRKSNLNSKKIWKIWKKGKLNSEMIWKIWKISVLVINTSKYTSSSSSSSSRPPLPPSHPPSLLLFILPANLLLLPSIHVYTLFFRIEKNHPGIVFVRDYASRDQMYHFIHLTLRLFSRNTTVRTRM